MKIIIDIPKNRYAEICGGMFDVDGYFKVNMTLAFRNGTRLPDNATNGDVIKALFPEAYIDESQYQTPFIDVSMNGELKSFHADWWNAPYKRGDIE